MTRPTTRIAAATILGGFALASVVSTAPLAARADDADPGVARIGLLSGGVDVKRADSGDTLAAAVNAPLNVGDYLTTQNDGRSELQLDNRTVLRVGENAQLRFTNMTSSSNALQLAQGTVELRLFNGVAAHPEVDTPNATVRPDDNGRYRVTVDDNGNTFVTARSGAVDVVTRSATQTLDAGTTLEVTGDGARATTQTVALVPRDAFDRWNDERDRIQADAQSYAYTDPNIVGADDLDRYGSWSDVPGYGEAWRPSYAARWSPYHDGRWVWEPYYGWTWVSAEPWGWAPYHYGRWFYANQGWYWYPGITAYQPPVYRPALVAFFSFGLGGGGLGLGFGNVGWVPLAPFETFHPWWGGSRYYNRTPVVNNVTNITNVTNVTNNVTNVTINHYKNIGAPGGAVAVENGNFARGNFRNVVAVSPQQLRSASAVQGVVPIVPTHQNLALSHATAPLATHPVAPAFERFATARTLTKVQPFTESQAAVKTLAQRQYPQHAATFEKAAPDESAVPSTAVPTGSPAQPAPQSARTLQKIPPHVSSAPAAPLAPAAAASKATSASPWQRFKPTTADRPNASPPAPAQNASAQSQQRSAAVRAVQSTVPVQAARHQSTTVPASSAAASDAWKRFDHANTGQAAVTRGASSDNAIPSAARPQTSGGDKPVDSTARSPQKPVVMHPPVGYHQPVENHQPVQSRQVTPYHQQPVEYDQPADLHRAVAPPELKAAPPPKAEAPHPAAPANDSEKPPARANAGGERPQTRTQ